MTQESITYFVPGPAYVLEGVRQCLTWPVQPHRSPPFLKLYAALTERLPPIFRTDNDVYLVTGSATLGMEIALISTLGPDDAVLHLVNGAFSERWSKVSAAWGMQHDVLEVPMGEVVPPEKVRDALAKRRYSAVTVVHSETSTGVLNPVAEIAQQVRAHSDALVLVDTVSSLGGACFEMDAWGVDLALAGVQKALALPPGLTLLSISDRTVEQAARVPYRGFYTDLLRYRDKHHGGGTITTPAVPQVYALEYQARRIAKEGLEARWQRHLDLQARTQAWAAERGVAYASAPGTASPTVSCLRCPPSMDSSELRRRLGQKGFTVAGGYGPWKADTFRIGHMGDVQARDLEALLGALDAVLVERIE